MESLDVKNVIKFLHLVHNLKYSVRKGWEYRGIKNPETISGHMYAMGIMTFLINEESGLDRVKCLQLSVIHDLAECIVGDITPHDNIPEDVKHRMEDKAMKELCEMVGGTQGELIYELYKEYEAKETPEAKFVKDLDRFDMVFTACEYEERDNTPGSLQHFFDATEGKFEHPFIRKLVDTLKETRKASEPNV